MPVQWTTANGSTFGLGWFIALLVLIAVFILAIVGKMNSRDALLFGSLALSRLI